MSCATPINERIEKKLRSHLARGSIRIVVSEVDTTGAHNTAVGHADHAVIIQRSMAISWGNGSRGDSNSHDEGIPLALITRL